MPSLPSRERGLKCGICPSEGNYAAVAPLAGAWIEIFTSYSSMSVFLVAPLAGVWIEIADSLYKKQNLDSRSPRGSVD